MVVKFGGSVGVRLACNSMSYPGFFSHERELLLRFLREDEKIWQIFSSSLKKQHSLSSTKNQWRTNYFSSLLERLRKWSRMAVPAKLKASRNLFSR